MSEPGTCLITGATGFIGGHLAQRLVHEGYRVRCVVRESSNTALLQSLDVELLTGELTSTDSLVRALEGCRYVLHCAALVSDWATVQELRRVNVQATRRLLEASLAASVERFVHLSTTDVYGHPAGLVLQESYAPSRFANWYAQTKLAGEAEVCRLAAAGTLQTVIIRPATVYGPRSEAVIGEIAQALRAGTMLLIDGGRALAGLCYVENLLDLVLLAMRQQGACGEAFNATDGLDVTWKQFTEDLARGLDCSPARWSVPYWLASALGLALEQGYRTLRRATGLHTRPLLSRQAVQVMGCDQRFSNHKARELLGWEPRVGYQAGLEATLAWLGH